MKANDMDFDFENHAQKIREQRQAEMQAKQNQESRLHDIAKELSNKIYEYSQKSNQLSFAAPEADLVKLNYSYNRLMLITVVDEDHFKVKVRFNGDDNNDRAIDTGLIDREKMMTLVVDFVAGTPLE